MVLVCAKESAGFLLETHEVNLTDLREIVLRLNAELVGEIRIDDRALLALDVLASLWLAGRLTGPRATVTVLALLVAVPAPHADAKDSSAAEIGSVTMKAAIDRAGIDPEIIDDIRFGCCVEPADSLNVARVAALLAGIPDSVSAVTINRVCISGMESIISGMAMIQAGIQAAAVLAEQGDMEIEASTEAARVLH